MNKNKIINLIIILIILFRAFFIFTSPISLYQRDYCIYFQEDNDYSKVFNRDPTAMNPNRGFDYVLTIAETLKLPETGESQFYHPPLSFFIEGIVLRLLLKTNLTAIVILQLLKILPLIYMTIALIFIKRILKEFEVSENTIIFVLLLCGFNPLYIYFSGYLNNDPLLYTFSLISMYYLIKWYKNPTFKSAILMALFIGLGGFTKASSSVNMIIAGILFTFKFVKLISNYINEEKNKNHLSKSIKSIVLQAFIAILIMLPMLLIFQIRNQILFDIPLFAVPEGKDQFYIGDRSIIDRFTIFSNELLNWTLNEEDCNIFNQIITGNITHFSVYPIFVYIMKALCILQIFNFIIAGIKYLKNKKNTNINTYLLISSVIIIIWIVCYISFNITLPYSCTMHPRYISIAITFAIIMLYIFVDFLEKNNYSKICTIIKTNSAIFVICAIAQILSTNIVAFIINPLH